MTAFQTRPHIDVKLTDSDGDEIASTSVAEPLNFKIEFTMHIRGELKNPYTLEATLFYPDDGPSAEPVTYNFDALPPQDSPKADSDQ